MAGKHTQFPIREGWWILQGKDSCCHGEWWKESRKKKAVEILEKAPQSYVATCIRTTCKEQVVGPIFIGCMETPPQRQLTSRKPTSDSPSHLSSQFSNDPVSFPNQPPRMMCKNLFMLKRRSKRKGEWSDFSLARDIVVKTTRSLVLDDGDHA